MLADILGWFGVTQQLIGRIQVAGLTIAPALVGLFLTFSVVLLGRRRQHFQLLNTAAKTFCI
jgi:hypothetical protein